MQLSILFYLNHSVILLCWPLREGIVCSRATVVLMYFIYHISAHLENFPALTLLPLTTRFFKCVATHSSTRVFSITTFHTNSLWLYSRCVILTYNSKELFRDDKRVSLWRWTLTHYPGDSDAVKVILQARVNNFLTCGRYNRNMI